MHISKICCTFAAGKSFILFRFSEGWLLFGFSLAGMQGCSFCVYFYSILRFSCSKMQKNAKKCKKMQKKCKKICSYQKKVVILHRLSKMNDTTTQLENQKQQTE